MKQLFYLNKYIKKYRVKITLGFIFVVLSNLSALLPANLIGKSFDLIIEEINLYTSSSQSKLFETIILTDRYYMAAGVKAEVWHSHTEEPGCFKTPGSMGSWSRRPRAAAFKRIPAGPWARSSAAMDVTVSVESETDNAD